MDSQRNCALELADYIQSLGVKVNIAKNKARGNKGFFCSKGGEYRIDISKSIDEISVLSTLLHEFAHFIHYKSDKSLKSLDFVFPNLTEEEEEELLQITVKNVPKDFARSLLEQKESYVNENKRHLSVIKKDYPDFKISKPNWQLERFGFFASFDISPSQSAYIKLKTNLRIISKINTKINKMNKYYNQPSELWARFFEFYFMNQKEAVECAPLLSTRLKKVIENRQSIEIASIYEILKHYL